MEAINTITARPIELVLSKTHCEISSRRQRQRLLWSEITSVDVVERHSRLQTLMHNRSDVVFHMMDRRQVCVGASPCREPVQGWLLKYLQARHQQMAVGTPEDVPTALTALQNRGTDIR